MSFLHIFGSFDSNTKDLKLLGICKKLVAGTYELFTINFFVEKKSRNLKHEHSVQKYIPTAYRSFLSMKKLSSITKIYNYAASTVTCWIIFIHSYALIN